jgi:hypothetical protein
MEGVQVGPWMEIKQQEYDWLAEQPEHDCNQRMGLDNRATGGWLKDKATSRLWDDRAISGWLDDTLDG